MLSLDKGERLTPRQQWWRYERLPKIEVQAYELLMAHERRYGRIEGCAIQTEFLLRNLGCNLVYFSDEERESYGIPVDAIGALKPFQREVFIFEGIENRGRENQTIGEEIGHFVLHAKGVAPVGQGSFDFSESTPKTAGHVFFTRTEDESFVDGEREPGWMSREAAYFGVCLQMPKDRYGNVAKQRLIERLKLRHGRGNDLILLDERINSVKSQYGIRPEIFDDHIINEALRLLEQDHRGAVSKASQRRRMMELGFILDAADAFHGIPYIPRFKPFEHFIISDNLISQFLRGKAEESTNN